MGRVCVYMCGNTSLTAHVYELYQLLSVPPPTLFVFYRVLKLKLLLLLAALIYLSWLDTNFRNFVSFSFVFFLFFLFSWCYECYF